MGPAAPQALVQLCCQLCGGGNGGARCLHCKSATDVEICRLHKREGGAHPALTHSDVSQTYTPALYGMSANCPGRSTNGQLILNVIHSVSSEDWNITTDPATLVLLETWTRLTVWAGPHKAMSGSSSSTHRSVLDQ